MSELYFDAWEDKVHTEEQSIVEQIFILGGGDVYHTRPDTYELVNFEDLSADLQEMSKVQEVYKQYDRFRAEYETKAEVKKFLDCTGKEEEIQKELYIYNLEHPEQVNALCETLLKENVDTFDVNMIGYFDESEEFEKLVDEYLKL